MKIIPILVVRPQFIKVGGISKEIAKDEDINCILTDMLFCPTQSAIDNLNPESYAQFTYQKHIFNADFNIDLYTKSKTSKKILEDLIGSII